ncbi:MAG: tRNA (adenosine(37)-N6)-dimethylallyltransferase MiaA [Elusimicrobiota bacterium]
MKTVIVIVGPTATGKTEVAIRLAKKLNGEIISADSRQIYKYMDIGTNKPNGKWSRQCGTNGKRQYVVNEIYHHLIDIINPDENFSAGNFVELANKKINEIFDRGKTPLIVGGTGLYIKALIDGLIKIPKSDERLRLRLNKFYKTRGIEYLYSMLEKLDSETAKTIDRQNPVRVLRALEICLLTGKKFSELKKQTKKSEYKYVLFGLKADRNKLYGRINDRVDKMVKTGLITEVKKLIKKYATSKNTILQNTIGYSEIIKFLNGKLSKKEAIDLIKQNTRHYAKRQMTWFSARGGFASGGNKDKQIIWIDSENNPSKKILTLLEMGEKL